MVLKAAKLAYANKTKESIIFQKCGSQVFCLIANSVFNKCKSAIPPLFNSLELSSGYDNAKMFAKNLLNFMYYSDHGVCFKYSYHLLSCKGTCITNILPHFIK